jgi:hypothetical protein
VREAAASRIEFKWSRVCVREGRRAGALERLRAKAPAASTLRRSRLGARGLGGGKKRGPLSLFLTRSIDHL